ncbi:MAG: hypothetical protein QOD99_2833 [Chthoniobacter sp.]|jgi:uncharacterized protein YbbC (DUF1343 family)|nr:hypothetical protein [Chthoniobacter sp.]
MPFFKTKIFAALSVYALLSARMLAVELGIDVLEKQNFASLDGRRVGLVTNQTGVDSSGTKTRLILSRARNCKLIALFSPEHGLDGTEGAGRYVASRRDSATGLPVHSLYGPTRKPSPQMLNGIDTLVYDLQDIGCRSYTYISTMAKCMEACGEKGIEFVVLDRPNPLGGVRIEGPPMESRWISFIGQLPTPYVHGMTCGELAKMANAFGWVQPRCKLTVVNMQGWGRQMTWADTGLRWVKPSPNIPNSSSPFYYVVTGMIGELAGFETGVGGSTPFEIAGTKSADAGRVTRAMQELHTPGVTFSPYASGFQGVRLRIEPHNDTNLTAVGIHLLSLFNAGTRPDLFARSRGEKLELFFKSYGSESIRSAIENGTPVSRIVAGWSAGVARFQAQRAPFLSY